MNKRQLGKTNINLNAIGFGGAPLGDLFENLKETNCYEILAKCYEANINLYDTSPLYGYGLSEHRLGNFLKTVKEYIYYSKHLVQIKLFNHFFDKHLTIILYYMQLLKNLEICIFYLIIENI